MWDQFRRSTCHLKTNNNARELYKIWVDLVDQCSWEWAGQPKRGHESNWLSALVNSLNASICAVGWERWRGIYDGSGVFSIKTTCFVWHTFKNTISIFSNLIIRGITVSSTFCPFCRVVEECINHIFFSCHFALMIWKWLVSLSSIFQDNLVLVVS